MATSKTLAPTGVTIQIPAMTDVPDQSVNSNCIDKLGDAVNTLNSQIAVYTAPSGSSIKQLAFNDSICPSNGVKWINLRNCSTSDLPNANAVYGLARVIRRVATVARVELYLDNGTTYIATATDSGSTWTAWFEPNSQVTLKRKTKTYKTTITAVLLRKTLL